jgi:hypothetical protein
VPALVSPAMPTIVRQGPPLIRNRPPSAEPVGKNFAANRSFTTTLPVVSPVLKTRPDRIGKRSVLK